MSFEIQILRTAQRQLAALERPVRERITSTILELAVNPRPSGSKKLSGRDGWRIRVGDFRVIYEILEDRLVVLVVEVGHRREIYR